MSRRNIKGKLRKLVFIAIVAIVAIATIAFQFYHQTRQELLNNNMITAIRRNDVREVIAFLHEGADANATYVPRDAKTLEEIDIGQTPTIDSNRSFWKAMLDQLLDRHQRKQRGLSALIVALDNQLECPSDVTRPPKDKTIIAALLEKGADVNARGRDNDTPLRLALEYGRRDITYLLLSHKANVKLMNDFGNTTLMGAAYNGDADLVSYFLDKGVNVNVQNKAGYTALMLAVYCRTSSNVQVVRLLLNHHAKIDCVGKDGETALTLANHLHKMKIVQMLKTLNRKST